MRLNGRSPRGVNRRSLRGVDRRSLRGVDRRSLGVNPRPLGMDCRPLRVDCRPLRGVDGRPLGVEHRSLRVAEAVAVRLTLRLGVDWRRGSVTHGTDMAATSREGAVTPEAADAAALGEDGGTGEVCRGAVAAVNHWRRVVCVHRCTVVVVHVHDLLPAVSAAAPLLTAVTFAAVTAVTSMTAVTSVTSMTAVTSMAAVTAVTSMTLITSMAAIAASASVTADLKYERGRAVAVGRAVAAVGRAVTAVAVAGAVTAVAVPAVPGPGVVRSKMGSAGAATAGNKQIGH